MKRMILILSTSLILSACGNILRWDSGFCGKIIDKETSEPIAGVVVIGDWENVAPSPGGAVHSIYRVTEVATNALGEFCLKGPGLVFFVDEPSIEIFKAGYTNIPDPYFPNLKDPKHYTEDEISWDFNKATIRLRNLSLEERLARYQKLGRSFDIYIDSGIKSGPKGETSLDQDILRSRSLFDAEVNKEIAEVKQYRDQLKNGNEHRKTMPIYGKPPSKAPIHIKELKPPPRKE